MSALPHHLCHYALCFVAQLPAFNWAWGEIYERNTRMTLSVGEPDEKEQQIRKLVSENATLKRKHRESLLFWQTIAHLTGMGFSLLACTAAGQPGDCGRYLAKAL